MTSIAEQLRSLSEEDFYNSPWTTKQKIDAAADEIDRLTKERDAARLGRDILRQQLRDAGIEPLITE